MPQQGPRSLSNRQAEHKTDHIFGLTQLCYKYLVLVACLTGIDALLEILVRGDEFLEDLIDGQQYLGMELWQTFKRYHIEMVFAVLTTLTALTWGLKCIFPTATLHVRSFLTKQATRAKLDVATVLYLEFQFKATTTSTWVAYTKEYFESGSGDPMLGNWTGHSAFNRPLIGLRNVSIDPGVELLIWSLLPSFVLLALIMNERHVRGVVAPLLAILAAIHLYIGTPAAWTNLLLLVPRGIVTCLLLFGVHYFWMSLMVFCFGCPLLATDSKYCKVNKPEGTLQKKCAFLINAPVYNEPDATIFKTVDGMAKLSRLYPGVCLSLVTDDFMWAEKNGVRRCPADQQERRRCYLRQSGVIAVNRPAHGRTGSFPKGSNVNCGLNFVVALLRRIKAHLVKHGKISVAEVRTACRRLALGCHDSDDHVPFGSLEIDVPEQAERQLAALTLEDIDNFLNLQLDADTEVPTGEEDLLSLYARAFEVDPKMAIAQIATMGFCDEEDLWSKYATWWTSTLFWVAILLSTGLGCPAPLVGHNCIIRLGMMIEVAEERKLQGILAGFGGLEFWSERTPGEDFELMLQMLALGYSSVYFAFTPGWKESVAPSVHVEINSLRKHCQTTLSLVFNSWKDFRLTGSPFNSLIGEFLVPFHSDNSPWYSKIGVVGYMATHMAFALVLPATVMTICIWLWIPSAGQYTLPPFVTMRTVFFLFSVFGPITTQVIRRVHLIPTLRETDAAPAIPSIATPGVLGMVKEVFVYGTIALIYWSGLHVHLLGVLVCFFIGKTISFGAAHAATDEITGASWLGNTKRVLSMYPLTYTFLAASLGSLLLLLAVDYSLDTVELVPDGPSDAARSRYGLLAPLVLVLLGPMVAPLVLDLMNIPFKDHKTAPLYIPDLPISADSFKTHRSSQRFDEYLAETCSKPSLYEAQKWLANAEAAIKEDKWPAKAEAAITEDEDAFPMLTRLSSSDWRMRAAKGKMPLPGGNATNAPPIRSDGGLLIGQSVSSGKEVGKDDAAYTSETDDTASAAGLSGSASLPTCSSAGTLSGGLADQIKVKIEPSKEVLKPLPQGGAERGKARDAASELLRGHDERGAARDVPGAQRLPRGQEGRSGRCQVQPQDEGRHPQADAPRLPLALLDPKQPRGPIPPEEARGIEGGAGPGFVLVVRKNEGRAAEQVRRAGAENLISLRSKAAQLAELKNKESSMVAKIVNQAKCIATLNNSILQLKAELSQATQTVTARQAEVGRHGRQLQLACSGCDAAKTELRRWKDHASRYITKNSQVQESKRREQEALASLQISEAALAQSVAACLRVRQQLEVKEQHCERLRATLERDKVAYRTRLSQKYDAIVSSLKADNSSLKADNDTLSATISSLKARLGGAAMAKSRVQTEVRVLQRELRSVERFGMMHARDLNHLCRSVGLSKYKRGIAKSVPPRHVAPGANVKMHHSLSVRHVSSVMRGRGVDVLTAALLKSHGPSGPSLLMASKGFQPAVKAVIQSALEVQQQRWNDGKFGLYVMTMLNLSRREYELARHLCSHSYDADTDKYTTLSLWQNPFDSKDSILCPSWASRQKTEKERDQLFEGCDVLVREDGGCERDARLCWEATLSTYFPAMREISESRPAILLIFADATGAWRGKSVTHVEVGLGCWAEGKSLSKLTLDPVALGEGKDDCAGLHQLLGARMAPSVDAVIARGAIDIAIPQSDGTSQQRSLPARCCFSADFQAHKGASAQHSTSANPWLCNKDVNRLPGAERQFLAYSDVTEYYKEMKSNIKDGPTLCEHAHESFELWMGKPYKPFKCKLCGWQSGPTKKCFLAKKQAHLSLPPEELKEAELEHARGHFWKLLFKVPVFRNPKGMMAHIPDGLHLVWLNAFLRFWTHTIYLKLNDAMQLVAQEFLRKCGFPIKLRSDDPNLANGFIGRDTKKFINELELLLPPLLHMANCPSRAGQDAAAAAVGAAEVPDDDEDDDEDVDDDFLPTDDEVAAETAAEPEMMQHAQDWDDFRYLALVAMRPFDSARGDTIEYRQERALEYFNAAVKVAAAMTRHAPTSTSAIGNVMVEVVPQMIIEYGDQLGLGADCSEAFGADIKFTIHRRVVRRPPATSSKEHTRKKIKVDGEVEEIKWKQTFSRGRVEQTFRFVCLRRRMMTLPQYAHLRMRGHSVVAKTGRAALPKHVSRAESPSSKWDMNAAMTSYVPG